MKRKGEYIIFFLLILGFGIGNLIISLYFNQVYLGLAFTLLGSGILVFVISKFNNRVLGRLITYLENIDLLSFTKDKNLDIPMEIQDSLGRLTGNIKESLRTQVESSTEIFHICEKLNAVSQESLASAETIASSVETADANTMEQANMLTNSSNLTNRVYNSLKSMEGDMVDKVEFISRTINRAQKGIEGVGYIKERIKESSKITENLSKEILLLKEYSDEVVGLIDLISDISRETNMLSLNASIEAARAGDYGAGFGIVAREVGKLAKETEEVSAKIGEIVLNFKERIDTTVLHMEKDLGYQKENYSIIRESNREFQNILEGLNIGKDSLEHISRIIKENNQIISNVKANLNKVASSSKEIASHMEETTVQVLEQENRSHYLQDIIEDITENVYRLQQFVVGNVMEEQMLDAVYFIRDYVKARQAFTEGDMDYLLKETGIDDILITDTNGIVIHAADKQALGLNLYEVERSFLALKEGKRDWVATPIKKRVQDKAMFKFLALIDDKQIYQVGLSLDSLLKI